MTEQQAPAPARADIRSREDCETLVRAFYTRVLTDPVIGWLFTDVAKLDVEEHVPRITLFWETMLLGARTYGGGAFRPHLELNLKTPLKRGHFERWLYLWRATVHELFTGPVAEAAIDHAERVAAAFSSRLDAINGQPAAQAADPDGFSELPLVQQYRPGGGS